MYANHVSFNAPFVREHTPSSAAGRDLLEILTNKIEPYDVHVRGYSSTDYSHGADVIFKQMCIHLEVGAVGDINAQWLLFFGLRRPLFGLRNAALSGKLSEFSMVLHNILVSLPDVEEIRWYKNVHIWNHHAEDKYWESPNA